MANNGNLKPFVKGDPRINRKGRPKSFEKWRKLNMDILSEIAINAKTGEPVVIETVRIGRGGEQIREKHYATNAELIVRAMMRDKKHAHKPVEAAFGKVPQAVAVTSGGEKIAVSFNWTVDATDND